MPTTRPLVLLLATGALAVSAVPALAKGGDDDVRRAGQCSGSSSSKLKLSDEDGGLEVEFEVDENRRGRTWDVTVRAGGTRVLKRAATTRGRSGSFEVRAVTGAGRTVTARAVSRRTGEVCTARASP